MEIVYVAGILLLLGCIWWELRAVRKLVQPWQELDSVPPDGPVHTIRTQYETVSGTVIYPSPSSLTAVAYRNPQKRASEYRRTNLEKLRQEAKEEEAKNASQ